MKLRQIAIKLIPASLKSLLIYLRAKLFDIYAVRSYSQEGEDMVLRRIFSNKEHGFYVDVGAHHPQRFSNTYGFYRRGWRGINIEPNPDGWSAFRRERKRDINLQVGISDHAGTLKYYMFDDPALNSFDAELTASRLASTPFRLLGIKEIAVERLEDILNKYLPAGQEVDFLSIDVEGLDMAVLRSNDWNAFRPRYVLVESLDTSLESAIQGEIYLFMKTWGYELFAKTYNTLIFSKTECQGSQRNG
jgi:FkbM family methyltransferase